MARTVVAIYDTFQSANNAVQELVDNNVPRDNISLIANNTRGEYGYRSTTMDAAEDTADNVAEETGSGAGVGAGIGAAIGGIGGLLVGLGALTIPGIGPVIAAGPLAVALSTLTGAGVGAVAGGVTGGLLGALIGLGIPEEEAEYYAEGVRRGGVLLTVQADDLNTNQVMDILNRHDPIDINERVVSWREEGWSRFDPNAEPYEGGRYMTDRDVMDRDLGSQSEFERDMTDRSVFDRDVTERDLTDRSVNDQDVFYRNMTSEDVDERDVIEGNQTRDRLGDDVRDLSGRMEMDTAGSEYSGFEAEFDMDNPAYRTHYGQYLSGSGYPYDYYVPAYRYGYGLSRNPAYLNRSWDDVEMDARRDWERDHPGTWERFKDSIRHAWEQVTR